MSYLEWIAAYVAARSGFVRGACSTATLEMVEAFPELRRAGGFVFVAWGRDEHFWCVAPDGSIVDPTAAQFPGGVFRYDELDLNDPKTREIVPTGYCMNCGGDTFKGATFCDQDCEADFGAALQEDAAERRNADRIDGYGRDDLGPSDEEADGGDEE